MDTPQDRVIKKMITNIVETNRPVFEKPATAATTTTSAPAASSAPALATEDYTLISRKLEYGFNNLRQENADLRKQIEELLGAIKMLRNDMDTIRSAVTRGPSHAAPSHAPARHAEESNEQPRGNAPAPQYRKSEADEAYDRQNGGSSHHDDEEKPASSQARGFKKEEAGAQIDIAKVFYYGKK